MKKLKLLIVDDEFEMRTPRWDRLFPTSSPFLYDGSLTAEKFRNANYSSYDAILLDINLTGWDMPLSEAIQRINGCRPIVLLSDKWTDSTPLRVSEALSAYPKTPIIQFIALNFVGDRFQGEEYSKVMRELIEFGINQFRNQARLLKNDGDIIRIMHLSDPQYKDPGHSDLSFLAESELKHILPMVGPIDLLLISGDIAYSGQPSEYQEAAKRLQIFIKRLFPRVEDRQERILLVPGNHDVNLKLLASDNITYSFLDKQATIDNESHEVDLRSYSLHPFRAFAFELTKDYKWHTRRSLNWINESFLHLGIRFYMLDSNSDIDLKTPGKAAYKQAAFIDLDPDRDEIRDPIFNIAISHHGFVDSSCEDEMCVEEINNKSVSLGYFRTQQIRLFLHGHGHARTSRVIDYSAACTRAGGSSLKVGRDHFVQVMAPSTHMGKDKGESSQRRGFTIIELKKRDSGISQVGITHYEMSAENAPQPDPEIVYTF